MQVREAQEGDAAIARAFPFPPNKVLQGVQCLPAGGPGGVPQYPILPTKGVQGAVPAGGLGVSPNSPLSTQCQGVQGSPSGLMQSRSYSQAQGLG
jgi:hypothetical protein